MREWEDRRAQILISVTSRQVQRTSVDFRVVWVYVGITEGRILPSVHCMQGTTRY